MTDDNNSEQTNQNSLQHVSRLATEARKALQRGDNGQANEYLSQIERATGGPISEAQEQGQREAEGQQRGAAESGATESAKPVPEEHNVAKQKR